MIKYMALTIIIVTLILASPVSAAEIGKGAIDGQIFNGTNGGGSVADQEIILKIYLDDAEVDSTTAIADAEGSFVFNNLATEAGYGYQVFLTYQEAEYSSEWLTFADGESIKNTSIPVYDSTMSNEAIRVEMAHTIVYIEPESLLVEEYLFIVNESDHTYIGSLIADSEDTRETLVFSLPEGASELQQSDGLMSCCIISIESGFADTMPVLPGSKEVIYNYRIYPDSGTYTYAKTVDYPVASFALLVQGDGAKIKSDQLITNEPLNIEGVQYNYLSASNLYPGETISVQFSGFSQSYNLGGIMGSVLALIMLTGGFGAIYLFKKRRRLQTIEPEDNGATRYQRELAELAQLDDDFEDGRIDEETYRSMRTERKKQLAALLKRIKE